MSKKALQNYPGHTKFVFDVPMYSKFRISEDDAIQLVCTGATIDGLCVVCGEKRVFRGKGNSRTAMISGMTGDRIAAKPKKS
jgi:hypothetical protein